MKNYIKSFEEKFNKLLQNRDIVCLLSGNIVDKIKFVKNNDEYLLYIPEDSISFYVFQLNELEDKSEEELFDYLYNELEIDFYNKIEISSVEFFKDVT